MELVNRGCLGTAARLFLRMLAENLRQSGDRRRSDARHACALMNAGLEHFPAKWEPVRRRKCDKIKKVERFPIQLERKALDGAS
jgi:hypothetical protein